MRGSHGGGYAGGGDGDNRGLHRSPSKHNCPIYHDSSNIGAMSGSISAPGGMGPKAVVVTGGPGLGGRQGQIWRRRGRMGRRTNTATKAEGNSIT